MLNEKQSNYMTHNGLKPQAGVQAVQHLYRQPHVTTKPIRQCHVP